MIREETIGLPLLNGVYIAVDAIPDCMLVVDGPYCVVHKAALQASHHLASNLFSPLSNGRVIPTHRDAAIEEVASVALNRDEILRLAIERTSKLAHPGILLATSFDYVELVQRPLRHIVQGLRQEGVPVAMLPGSSLKDDWVGGYCSVLRTLAEALPLPPPQPRPRTVGIVGYFFDRDEGDHQGNLDEIRRLVEAMGATVGAVWLSGQSTSSLAQISTCQALLSLPLGHEAAGILGKRLGIPVCPAPLPLGLHASAHFVELLGDLLDCPQKARSIASQEIDVTLAKAAPHVEQFLSGASATIALEPTMALAMAAFCDEMGIHIAECWGVRDRLVSLRPPSPPPPPPPQAAPTEAARLRRHFHIASSIHQQYREDRIPVHFGYPDLVHHYLNPHPFLGFSGTLQCVSDLTQAVLTSELKELSAPL